MPQPALGRRAEYPQEQHIPGQVQDRPMQEHGRQHRQRVQVHVGNGEPGHDTFPHLEVTVAGERKNERVEDDQADRHIRKDFGRVFRPERQHE